MAQVSDEALKAKTGKTLQQWVKIIDDFGGADMTHKQIAQKLWDDKLIKNGWWCQQVTVDYEFAKGRRIRGETADAGFEIGVSKTMSKPAGEIWELLTSDQGLKLWLGDINADDIRFDKGQEYETKDGTIGQIRSVYPREKLRLTWQPKSRKTPITLQIYLTPNGNKTSVLFHNEKLADAKDRETMRKHWQTILEKFEGSLV